MKKSIILLFIASILVMNCQQPSSSSGGGGGDGGTPAKTYAIGDTGPSGVGIVFYISNGGLHGLEAAPSLWNGGAADPTLAWITGGATQTTLNGNTLTGIGTGSANTDAIIAQNFGAASAAKLCRDYHGGGKTDWFLPSKDELMDMWSALASTAGDRITYGFTDDYYWSSSEFDASNAWGQNFLNSILGHYFKASTTSYVRAVRAF